MSGRKTVLTRKHDIQSNITTPRPPTKPKGNPDAPTAPVHRPEEKAESSTSTPAKAEEKSAADSARPKKPTVVLVIGMAGSGKTTLMQRINAHVNQFEIPSYIINLDPAVHKVPYEPNIDIRDTVNYKEVMKQYRLGPNGGILTSLNLFATRFDQVLELIEKRADQLDYIFIDTPGQIEVFTWSASGQIITESLAADYPTVCVYVTDTPRCMNPTTFMSNMSYACSIMYKTRLPFLIAFNKIDIESHQVLEEWMASYENMQEALDKDTTYMSSLVRSMSLVLEEFYKTISTVGISALTGAGMLRFFNALETGKQEYWTDYRPSIDAIKEENKRKRKELEEKQIERIKTDMKKAGGDKKVLKSAQESTKKSAVLADLDKTADKPPQKINVNHISNEVE